MTKRVTELSIPSVSLRNDALHAVDHGESYDLWAAKFGCLNELQLIPGKSMERASGILRIGAWNLERGRDWSAASQLIREQGLDVVLLSEMDCGMSRSLQAHTTQQLAQELGWHGLFAVEFVELELGNAWELATPTELENAAGLHGNAIISRFPLKTPWLHRFRQSDGSWWHRQFHEPRLGGRIALGAILETDIGDIQIMTTHLENNQGPDDRAEALAELFQAQLDHRPCVFGGDLNTSTFNPTLYADPFRERAQLATATPDRFLNPVAYEPLFDLAHIKGFQWGTSNTQDTTQRPRERGYPRPPLGRIDWLMVKQLVAQHPQTVPAVDGDGATLSDHDLITCEIKLT